MPAYKTPGVYVKEIRKFPPSVAEVATAIPAFIGRTDKQFDRDGTTPLLNVPKRITSLMEFEELFGLAKPQAFKVKVAQKRSAEPAKQIISTSVTLDPAVPDAPADYFYYSMQLYFSNGGGPCYVVSIGKLEDALTDKLFTDALMVLEALDEPTLLVFPDACKMTSDEYAIVANNAMTQCQKLQDRFTILDVVEAIPTKIDSNDKVTSEFRTPVTNIPDQTKYGAAYMPYLRTSLPFRTNDDIITVSSHKITTLKPDGTDDAIIDGSIGANKKISDISVKVQETLIYNEIKRVIDRTYVTLPPSGAIAGCYALVDRTLGVWRAPANVSLTNVIAPALAITNDLNDNLNVDATSGKSVNAIRAFAGQGTLVWGARTLAGNDLENRYVSVRRFLNFAEESIKKACVRFVFENNDANTWVRVQSMIESFLTRQWREGALAGAKQEDAFYVRVGLNKTMSAMDILEGIMIVEVGLAIVRPAEFIVLHFSQMMQRS